MPYLCVSWIQGKGGYIIVALNYRQRHLLSSPFIARMKSHLSHISSVCHEFYSTQVDCVSIPLFPAIDFVNVHFNCVT